MKGHASQIIKMFVNNQNGIHNNQCHYDENPSPWYEPVRMQNANQSESLKCKMQTKVKVCSYNNDIIINFCPCVNAM